MPTFLRRISNRYSKLGKGRKKKQIWRKPTGRDNKMRERRRGYPVCVSVGYKVDKTLRHKLNEKSPVRVSNVSDLKKVGKDQIAVIGSVGKKKKIEIATEAKKQKITLYNMNTKIFLEKIEKQNKEKKK